MKAPILAISAKTLMPLQVLWEDGERVFSRAMRDDADGARRTFVVITPAAENPTGTCLDRLAHEYSLRDDLDAPWALRPLDLVRERGRIMLVLDDPGAEPLWRHLGIPMALPKFLHLAGAMAAALRGLHERGLVHKDINPANILVDEKASRVWLTGFGIASRLPRERQAPSAPESIAGTPAYMSPEQTGRMNRSVDSRSDLYSLGVMFYEMLTGSMPFTASDPMEWVHRHIAGTPAPLTERAPTVPAPISRLVTKLLAKTADDRYQTAAGVEHDLRRCGAEWDLQGSIEMFALAEHDVPDRLLIPETLYGRSVEVAILLGAFDKVVATGVAEFVLVSGFSGAGKSSVVNELHKALVTSGGLFASGKFDQYKRDTPYATVAQAFGGLVRQILSKSEMEFQDWRRRLDEALGLNGRLIVDLIPELGLVIGDQPTVTELAPQAAQRRFQAVLRRFIGVFASPEHPLALFLDDLQWLDAATLDLLQDLLTQDDIGHFLLIGAYRDNEVDDAHPLTRKLGAIRRSGAKVQDIVLAPLSYEDLGQLIADALHCEPERTASLTQLVQEKTGGNPFFAIQFLQALADEGLLTFDHAEARWSWDLRRIHAKRYTDNVVDLMVAKLGRLPAETLGALRLLACTGSGATFAFLGTVCQLSLKDLGDRLWEAVRAGLVVRAEHGYAFQHDRIQEAAYSLVPAHARAEAHLRIGRLLLAHTPPEAREEVIFEIVSQYNRGAKLIELRDERDALALLNLIAGKRAKNTAAYASARTYFADGRALLAAECWTRQYALTFDFELYRAECEFLTGDLTSAEERLSMLSSRAVGLVDQARVTSLRVDLYIILVQSERAVDVGLEYLRKVGFEAPQHPTNEDVLREYERFWQRLGTRRIEALIHLPFMEDAAKRATMDVLTKVTPSAHNTDKNLNRLLVAYMVNLSLEYGNSDASCVGYVWIGRALATDFENYAAAVHFGQLSLALVDERGLEAFKARVYILFATGISPWSRHFRSTRTLLSGALEAANKVGDLLYIGLCRVYIITNSIILGEPLGDIEREAGKALEFARKTGSKFFNALFLGHLCLIRTLRGLPYDFGLFDDEPFDEGDFRRHLDTDLNLAVPACFYWTRRLQLCAFMDDYPAALEASDRAQALLKMGPPVAEVADYHFYAALVESHSFDTADAAHRVAHLEAVAVHHGQLRTWAEQCPQNFESRAALVGAEIARLEGRELDAERLYHQATRSARASGFIHDEALACETAARFYAARGFGEIAEMFLTRARDRYLRWGADGKVRQLEARYPHLTMVDPYGQTRAAKSPDQHVDVAAVVKASQALSSEMLLPRLIERLMTIAVQNAGADRGLLILPHQDDYRIEAEAQTDAGGVTVCYGASDGPMVPETLIRYVMRTQERLIIDDVAKPHLFSDDPYLALRRPRAILCLPLVRQGALSGLLYLENTLAANVFTPERSRLLELLASQAAISLENAALYTDLQRNQAFLSQGQQISQSGSFGWNAESQQLYWSEGIYNILEYDRSVRASYALTQARVHPDDMSLFRQAFDDTVRDMENFEVEHRLLMPDGRVKNVHVIGRRVHTGNLDLVGAVRDITERTREEDLARERERQYRQSQIELEHANRVATMGQLLASITHEVSQPLTGVAINARTASLMLTRETPKVAEAQTAIARIVRDSKRASEVFDRIRMLIKKAPPQMERLSINELILEVARLTQGEAVNRGVRVRTQLNDALALIQGDRVQLQQVVLNLIMNALDAIRDNKDGPSEILISTDQPDSGCVHVCVQDSGPGVDPANIAQIFSAFYTTKATGLGMGLSICRSIVEAHEGEIWVTAGEHGGAIFQFTTPVDGGQQVLQ